MENKFERGLFITLEGGEGVGKTTQIEFIKNWLDKHNIKYLTTKEPGGTPLGEDIRNIVKYAKYQITPRAELLLINSARAELVDEVIRPALNNRITVVSDRFSDTSIPYQAYGRGLNVNDVSEICNYATTQIVPDITFWLDLPPKEAFKRKHGPDKSDRFEENGLDFHNRVYEGYKKLAQENPRIKRIDASKSIEEMNAQIEYYLTQKFLIEK